MLKTDFDLIIVGGGMVGASLACALKNSHLNIAIIEAFPVHSDQQPSYDDRCIALAYGSQRIFESIGLWSQLASHSTAITDIHISDRGHFGVTRLSANDENVPALGQVISARAMGKVLNHALAEQHNLELICPAKVIDLTQHPDHVNVILDNNRQLSTKLIVAADGANSTIKQLLKLGAREQDYHQTAITANITPERPHNGCAFERFTDAGPLALLPMSDNRCNLVWTVTTGDESDLLQLSDHDFLKQLQDRFGYRLGTLLKVGQRNSYPLKLIQTDQPIQHRIALIGNAAHSLHPIAGQGFNLGLRDVAALAEVLSDDFGDYGDCGNARLLHDYNQWRQHDQDTVITNTTNLVALFSNTNPILGHLRGAGLTIVDALPIVKHWLAQKSMGLEGKQPRLGRGVPL